MNNNILNQKGLTLIELLASLIITITLSFFAFNLLTKGLDHYENIKYTNSLRDEADYLMALLVKKKYTLQKKLKYPPFQINSLTETISSLQIPVQTLKRDLKMAGYLSTENYSIRTIRI